jgi:hypothetical protein
MATLAAFPVTAVLSATSVVTVIGVAGPPPVTLNGEALRVSVNQPRLKVHYLLSTEGDIVNGNLFTCGCELFDDWGGGCSTKAGNGNGSRGELRGKKRMSM